MISLVREFLLFGGVSPVIADLAKATAALVLGLAATWLARRSRAAVRHSFLAVTFGALFLLPLGSYLIPPVMIPVAVNAPVIQTTDTNTPLPVNESLMPIAQAPVSPSPYGISTSALLFALWLSGVFLFLIPFAISLWHSRVLRCTGLPWRDTQTLVNHLASNAGIRRQIDARIHESLTGPVTCGILHPAVFFPPDAQAWSGEDLDRAIVHELEHVRRGDRIWHSLSRALCAVYWFHPLVWIAWRRLALEAERSCDDAVLAQGEGIAYADQLVSLARRVSSRRSPVLAMASRADIAIRVSAALDPRQPRGRASLRSTVLACGCAFLFVISMSVFRLVAAPQSAATAVDKTPEFQAVSIKLIDPASEGQHWHEHSDATYANITGSLHGFILRTYGIRDAQLTGEPSWFNTRLYNIEAKTTSPVSEKEMLLLVRGVLTSRFKLKLREEPRDMPVYSLEVAPRGPKFRELKPGEEVPKFPQPPPDIYGRTFTSVQDMMNQLNGVFGGPPMANRPVVDRSQLGGNYVMRLDTERESQPDGSGHITLFPDLAADMQSQLGLRLVADHQPMTAYVVEHAEAPTPN